MLTNEAYQELSERRTFRNEEGRMLKMPGAQAALFVCRKRWRPYGIRADFLFGPRLARVAKHEYPNEMPEHEAASHALDEALAYLAAQEALYGKARAALEEYRKEAASL